MMFYCALIFQVITFWDSDLIRLTMKDSTAHTLRVVQDLNYVSAEYGHEVVSWGATMKECELVPAKDHLRFVGYFVEFDGDGKACR